MREFDTDDDAPEDTFLYDFSELEDYWPSLEDEPDGKDIFEEKYGPPTGTEGV